MFSELSEERFERAQTVATTLAELSIGAVLALWWLGGEVAYVAGCRLVQSSVCETVRTAETVAMTLAGVALLGFVVAFAIEHQLDDRADEPVEEVAG